MATGVKITQLHIARIAQLETQNGFLTPARVLEDARDPNSPLHELFDWDVQKAAEQHWLDRSREIIASVKYVERTETAVLKMPKYIEAPGKRHGEQGYVSIDALRHHRAAARQALQQEFARAVGALRRAKEVAAGLDLDDEIDEMIARLLGIRQSLANVEVVDATQTPPPPIQ